MDYISNVAFGMQQEQRRRLDNIFFKIVAEYGISRSENWLEISEQLNKAGIHINIDVNNGIDKTEYTFHVYKKIFTPETLVIRYK